MVPTVEVIIGGLYLGQVPAQLMACPTGTEAPLVGTVSSVRSEEDAGPVECRIRNGKRHESS